MKSNNKPSSASITVDNAAAYELVSLLKANGYHKLRFPVYPGMFKQVELDELDLSSRSEHGLKRSGVTTLDRLLESIEGEEDLMRFKNLGQVSVTEIMFKIYLYQYVSLPAEKKQDFLLKTAKMSMTDM